jgi:hypothetical protein
MMPRGISIFSKMLHKFPLLEGSTISIKTSTVGKKGLLSIVLRSILSMAAVVVGIGMAV